MSDGALVIVDMRRRFAAARAPLLRARVARRVEAFARRGDPVVVLEYEPWCDRRSGDWDTFPDVVRPLAARRWANASCVQKSRDDGSPEAMEELRGLGFPAPSSVTVVGVNRGACVIDTAVGLAAGLPGSRVLVDWSATGCDCGWEGPCKSPDEYDRYLTGGGRRPNIALLRAFRRSRLP